MPLPCYQDVEFWLIKAHGEIMFKANPGPAHLQQPKIVDQSTLASPGQVAAPQRVLRIQGEKPIEVLSQGRREIVS